MLPTGSEVGQLFIPRLKEAQKIYDFNDKSLANENDLTVGIRSPRQIAATPFLFASAQATSEKQQAAPATAAASANGAQPTTNPSAPLDKVEATKLWDRLQLRGCCGIQNSTEWNPLPKSCCNQDNRLIDGDKVTCKSIDASHERSCATLIESSNCNLMIVLGSIAIVNLYLAFVSGINAYRTFNYNEASQNAYT